MKLIKIDKIDVWGFEHALRGMRNPLNSWDRSDSDFTGPEPIVGEADLGLAKRLRNAGSDHGKFTRQIMVSFDLTASLTFYKEYDTYKVGTVANSTSTMHKILSKPIEVSDFVPLELHEEELEAMVEICEKLRLEYIETKDKRTWYALVNLLGCGYRQTRTITLNYEVLRNMYHARRHHKLPDWHEFCDFIETLPYAKELIIGGE